MGHHDRVSFRETRCLPAVKSGLRAAQSIPLNIAEGNGKQNLTDKNRYFQIARGSVLECAAVHDILRACAVMDEEANRQGKSHLQRIVSMLTRLIQRSDVVAQDAVEYEDEYRDAEYEQELQAGARTRP
jgi:four helix bundle protein